MVDIFLSVEVFCGKGSSFFDRTQFCAAPTIVRPVLPPTGQCQHLYLCLDHPMVPPVAPFLPPSPAFYVGGLFQLLLSSPGKFAYGMRRGFPSRLAIGNLNSGLVTREVRAQGGHLRSFFFSPSRIECSATSEQTTIFFCFFVVGGFFLLCYTF